MKFELSKYNWILIGERAGWLKNHSKKNKKTPKEHGFLEQCVKDNSDKKDPYAYCASIIDKAKGTTKWRKNKK
jgi:hypothetical protein